MNKQNKTARKMSQWHMAQNKKKGTKQLRFRSLILLATLTFYIKKNKKAKITKTKDLPPQKKNIKNHYSIQKWFSGIKNMTCS